MATVTTVGLLFSSAAVFKYYSQALLYTECLSGEQIGQKLITWHCLDNATKESNIYQQENLFKTQTMQ